MPQKACPGHCLYNLFFVTLPYEPISDHSGDADRARYALLYSKTQNKNHIFPTSDSLIDIAVDYYDRSGHDSLRMLAHFYRSAIRNSAAAYHAALRDGLMAKDIAARDFNRTGYHLNAQYVSVDKAAAHINRGHLHCIWPVYQSKQFV